MRASVMRLHRSSGMSLAELLVALVLLAAVSAAIMRTLRGQQRFYRDAADVLSTRRHVREAVSVIPAAVRGISPIGGDILAMSDSALDFRATIGSAVVCTHDTNDIVIPPVAAGTEASLTTFLMRPVIGDLAFVFDDSAAGVAGDRWQTLTIVGIDSTPGDCTGLPARVAVAPYRYRFTLSPDLSRTIVDGAPIRFARRSKYGIYRSPSDGLWWLGYRDCAGDGSSCGSTQPVSGPYRPFAAHDTVSSGISFVFRDSTGAITATPKAVARIDVFATSETAGAVEQTAEPAAIRREATKVTIGIRNRHRE